ncbi:hypothetical protein CH304_00220 [Rhodococcus sp. 15-649-1-2]|nr:hypothetical protein CH304_00220 [Rhodococcus sp. 15-649-1-2]
MGTFQRGVEAGVRGVCDVGDVHLEPRPRPFAEDVRADVDAPVVEVQREVGPVGEDVVPVDRCAATVGELTWFLVRLRLVPVAEPGARVEWAAASVGGPVRAWCAR